MVRLRGRTHRGDSANVRLQYVTARCIFEIRLATVPLGLNERTCKRRACGAFKSTACRCRHQSFGCPRHRVAVVKRSNAPHVRYKTKSRSRWPNNIRISCRSLQRKFNDHYLGKITSEGKSETYAEIGTRVSGQRKDGSVFPFASSPSSETETRKRSPFTTESFAGHYGPQGDSRSHTRRANSQPRRTRRASHASTYAKHN